MLFSPCTLTGTDSRGVTGMSYEHQVIKVFDVQESCVYHRDTVKISPTSLSWGWVWMNFSAPLHFLPLPHLSCKAHRGGSIGKTSLEAQQKAHGSCLDGLPVCLAQTYSHNPPTPVVCGVTVIPVSPRKSIWLPPLPSQLVQPRGAKEGAVSPTSTSL